MSAEHEPSDVRGAIAHKPASPTDVRVVQALDELRAALDAGQKVDRATLLSNYVDVAEPLIECLDVLQFNYIAAGSLRGNDVTVCDAHTGAPLFSLPQQRDALKSVAVAPSNTGLAAGFNDGMVTYWVVDGDLSGAVMSSRSMKAHDGPVTCVQFITDHRLVTCGVDGTAKIWDMDPSAHSTAVGATQIQRVEDLVFAPDGRELAIVDAEGDLWIRGRNGLRMLPQPVRDQSGLFHVAFSARSDMVATCNEDSDEIILWDAKASEIVGRILHDKSGVNDICFSPDGRLLASTGSNGQVRIWGMPHGDQLDNFRLPHHGWSLSFSPDGRYLACGGRFPQILLWDVSGRQVRQRFDTASSTLDVAFSPNGRSLATAHDDSAIRIWDIDSGGLLAELKGHTDHVHGIAFSTDGGTLASASGDGTVRLWSSRLWQEYGIVERRDESATALAFAPDGKQLAVGYSAREDAVVLWDITSTTAEASPLASRAGDTSGGKQDLPISQPRTNSQPDYVDLSSKSVAEHQPSGTVVGTFFTGDADNPTDAFTYTMAAGPGDDGNRLFIIVGDQLHTASEFDCETQSSYDVRVRSTDAGGMWTEMVFVIEVTDAE